MPEYGEKRQINCQSSVCRGHRRTVEYRLVADAFNFLRSDDEKLVQGQWLCIYCGEAKGESELEGSSEELLRA